MNKIKISKKLLALLVTTTLSLGSVITVANINDNKNNNQEEELINENSEIYNEYIKLNNGQIIKILNEEESNELQSGQIYLVEDNEIIIPNEEILEQNGLTTIITYEIDNKYMSKPIYSNDTLELSNTINQIDSVTVVPYTVTEDNQKEITYKRNIYNIDFINKHNIK